jgi:hypothetical protein
MQLNLNIVKLVINGENLDMKNLKMLEGNLLKKLKENLKIKLFKEPILTLMP